MLGNTNNVQKCLFISYHNILSRYNGYNARSARLLLRRVLKESKKYTFFSVHISKAFFQISFGDFQLTFILYKSVLFRFC